MEQVYAAEQLDIPLYYHTASTPLTRGPVRHQCPACLTTCPSQGITRGDSGIRKVPTVTCGTLAGRELAEELVGAQLLKKWAWISASSSPLRVHAHRHGNFIDPNLVHRIIAQRGNAVAVRALLLQRGELQPAKERDADSQNTEARADSQCGKTCRKPARSPLSLRATDCSSKIKGPTRRTHLDEGYSINTTPALANTQTISESHNDSLGEENTMVEVRRGKGKRSRRRKASKPGLVVDVAEVARRMTQTQTRRRSRSRKRRSRCRAGGRSDSVCWIATGETKDARFASIKAINVFGRWRIPSRRSATIARVAPTNAAVVGSPSKRTSPRWFICWTGKSPLEIDDDWIEAEIKTFGKFLGGPSDKCQDYPVPVPAPEPFASTSLAQASTPFSPHRPEPTQHREDPPPTTSSRIPISFADACLRSINITIGCCAIDESGRAFPNRARRTSASTSSKQFIRPIILDSCSNLVRAPNNFVYLQRGAVAPVPDRRGCGMTRSAQGEAEVSCEYEFNRVHSVVCEWGLRRAFVCVQGKQRILAGMSGVIRLINRGRPRCEGAHQLGSCS
ncbi:hypothetical protein L1887_41920 [Cichorium endivia]|nr:hypothetical protein L1887_41920 [Cichorium endivia]